MTIAQKIIPLLTLMLLIGCASAPPQVPFIDKKSGETEVGESARAFVGDIIYRKFDIKEQFEGYVSGALKISGLTISLADTRVQRMLVGGEDGAITRDPLSGVNFFGIPAPVFPILLIDNDSDGTFDKYWYQGVGEKKIKNPIFVDWEQSNRSSGYRRELIYQGRDGDNLKLFYREFTDDFRRPAYDQEVQYDMSESDSIQFKGLTISIQEANNEYIIYTIDGGSL
jgi:hypothetical protein|tara:strand:+ start:273 stop:950 length:678 start_codon:yes stop_codon:yes gene_type:complete